MDWRCVVGRAADCFTLCMMHKSGWGREEFCAIFFDFFCVLLQLMYICKTNVID